MVLINMYISFQIIFSPEVTSIILGDLVDISLGSVRFGREHDFLTPLWLRRSFGYIV